MVSKAETQAVCNLCSLKAQKAHTPSTAEGRAYLKVACPTSDCDIRASPCFCLSNYICLFTSSGGAELAGVGCGCVLCAVSCQEDSAGSKLAAKGWGLWWALYCAPDYSAEEGTELSLRLKSLWYLHYAAMSALAFILNRPPAKHKNTLNRSCGSARWCKIGNSQRSNKK